MCHAGFYLQEESFTTSSSEGRRQLNEYFADVVLVTLPIGVLKSRAVVFNPNLSQPKQEAISLCEVGNVVKVILQFTEAFWDHENKQHLWFVTDDAIFRTKGGKQKTPPASFQMRGLFTTLLNAHAVTGNCVIVGYALGEAATIVDEVLLIFK